MTDEIRLGDVIATRKPHPCGSAEWTVIRTGASIAKSATGEVSVSVVSGYEFYLVKAERR